MLKSLVSKTAFKLILFLAASLLNLEAQQPQAPSEGAEALQNAVPRDISKKTNAQSGCLVRATRRSRMAPQFNTLLGIVSPPVWPSSTQQGSLQAVPSALFGKLVKGMTLLLFCVTRTRNIE